METVTFPFQAQYSEYSTVGHVITLVTLVHRKTDTTTLPQAQYSEFPNQSGTGIIGVYQGKTEKKTMRLSILSMRGIPGHV